MITLVAGVLKSLLAAATFTFRLFHIFGRILVHLFCGLGQFLVLFYEEFSKFGNDVWDCITSLWNLLQNFTVDSMDTFCSVVEMAAELLTTGRISIGKLPSIWTVATTKLRCFVIDLICLLGNSVWMLIMFIPNLIIFLIRFAYLVVISMSTAIMDFFQELPLTALVGCVILGAFVTLHKTTVPIARRGLAFGFQLVLLPAQRKIQRELIRLQRETARAIQLNMNEIRRTMMRAMSFNLPQKTPQKSAPTAASYMPNESSGGSRCVICQEHEKSVVLFPCRHMCLCVSCATELRRYDNNCPLCRQPIVRSVTVFA